MGSELKKLDRGIKSLIDLSLDLGYKSPAEGKPKHRHPSAEPPWMEFRGRTLLYNFQQLTTALA